MALKEILQSKSLAELCHRACEAHQKRTAFVTVLPNGMNGSYSYSKLGEMSDHFAIYLREILKIPAGTKVAVQLPNCLSYPIVAFGTLKAGCVLVNTNPLYTVPEMIHQFNDAEVEVLVTADLFGDKAAQALGSTKIKQLVLTRLPEFFPLLPKLITQGVLKYWNQSIPKTHTPFDSLPEILKRASALQKEKKIRVENYWSSLGPEDLAVLQYTGGTTGVSKGAMLTHGNLLANSRQIIEFGDKHFEYQKECMLTALPLYHIFAFTVNLGAFFAIGTRNVLCPNPRPISNLQRAFENEPITWMAGVNTLFNALNQEVWFYETPPKKLKAAIAGGMALHKAVAERFLQITKVPAVEGYGLTETSPVTHFNPLDRVRPETVGIPMPETSAKLVNDQGEEVARGEAGEIWVKGPQVMKGYWKKPDETSKVLKDGWFATGDIAVIDESGYYKIVDRKKDMILVSGFNVYPNEVEDCLAKHPHVQEVAVIGIPDGASGEAVKAFIVPRGDRPSVEDLRAHCKSLLTAYKVPKHFEFMEELPKSPVGKILRKDLRQREVKKA